MAQQGAVAFLVDSNKLTTVSDGFVADVAALAPHRILGVRAPVVADARNLLPVETYCAALAAWRRAVMPVSLVMTMAVTEPWRVGAIAATDYPNAPLDAQFSNPYIRRYAATIVQFLQELGRYCPHSLWLWNEPNASNNTVLPGQNCPPGHAGLKPSALAPSIFGALLYYTASEIRRHCPNVREIWPGALSCLIRWGTDPAGSWVAGYYNAAFVWLAQQGVNLADPDLPFSGLWLNAEGNVTATYAAKMRSALAAVQTRWNYKGPLGIGEWGQTNASWNKAIMQAAYTSLDANFDYMFAFQHPWLSTATDYGLAQWIINGANQFAITGHSPSYADVQAFLAVP